MSAMHPVPKLATYDDLLALPEDVRAEVVDGQVVAAPSPLPEHSWAAGGLTTQIGDPFSRRHGRGGPGGWWILSEVDVELGPHDIVRPDVVGWRRERLPEPWGVRPIALAPDWVCEILSPSNEAHDRVKKAALYQRSGVPFYWLLNPLVRTLEAFKLVQEQWVRIGAFDDSSAKARIAPFEEVELEVGLLFPPQTA